jgi:nitrogen PTS system EIIA component
MVETGIRAVSKKEVIERMLEIACRSGKVKDRGLAARDTAAREELASTGMEDGIGIPHAKTDAVDELVACVGVTEKPVGFDAIDDKPCQIFIMTLSPKRQTGPHIRFLCEIALLLKDEARRKRMLAAGNATELLEALKG